MELTWEELHHQCMQCEKCALSRTRTNVVFGVGVTDAEVMFIGEGPGENEDLQGEPFVGRGGQLLDKYLDAIGLDRKKNIYIGNMVKCRPPQNRDPKPEEQEACIGWLRSQVRLLRPKIIVCLGRIAAQRLIDRMPLRISSPCGKKSARCASTPTSNISSPFKTYRAAGAVYFCDLLNKLFK